MAGHYLKRWLYLTHRWIGIVTCLLFVMWFASGLVMLYVPYPSLEREEWLAGQRPIDWAAVQTAPGELTLLAGSSDLRRLSLEMRGDRPVWRYQGWQGDETLYSATDGRLLDGAGEAEARQTAGMFAGAPVTAIKQLHNDQWTVAGGYNAHRPLWKASIAGDGGRELYVSSTDGSVRLETTSSERFWNWLGSVPHWIYPTVLRQDGEAWRQAVMWLSGPCIIGAITGIWIGILRVRLGKRRFRDNRISPYRGWMWWHHITGLAGSLFLVLWIFSGWLSVDPGHLFSSEGPGPDVQMAYAGELPPALDTAGIARMAPEARRITLGSAAGAAYVRIEQPGTEGRYVDPLSLQPLMRDGGAIVDRIAGLFSDRQIVDVTTIAEPDAYWYAVSGELPLPVLRVRFDDRAETWLHVDPRTGEVLGSMARSDRLYRWLYTFFHRWDANILLENRPARDVLIWVFSLLGLVSSASGVWIGWRRLRPQRPGRRVRTGARMQKT